MRLCASSLGTRGRFQTCDRWGKRKKKVEKKKEITNNAAFRCEAAQRADANPRNSRPILVDNHVQYTGLVRGKGKRSEKTGEGRGPETGWNEEVEQDPSPAVAGSRPPGTLGCLQVAYKVRD